jgi:pimeloyl-ACP methyl ester carboxylesterase
MVYWLVFGADFYAGSMAALDDLLASAVANPVPTRVFEYQARACLDHDSRPLLPRIHCPTLVTHGGQDILLPPHHGRELAEHIPGARLEIFERGGHLHIWEEPERFHTLLEEFMAG